MKDLISINSAPAKLAVNFYELKAALAKDLEKYRIVVTAETVKDAKALATELNATAKDIDRRRKDEVAAVSEPIREFDAQMRELVTMCRDGRQEILDQVQRFEDETRAIVRGLLIDGRNDLWLFHQVDDEFRRAEVDDLVLVSNLTAKGNLTKAAMDKLKARVRDDKALQDRTRMRLLELENQSYKAGLAAPLTRDHVKAFLFSDDDAYAAELQRILEAEVQRQEAAERRMRAQMDREARQKAENEEAERQRAAQRQQAGDEQAERVAARQADAQRQAEAQKRAAAEAPVTPEPQQPQPPSNHEPAPKQGATDWRVTCTFDVTTAAEPEAIEAELRRVMKRAGITTLASVHVAHKQKAA